MQSVKHIVRQIGVPNNIPADQGGIMSGQEYDDYVEYNLTSNGYVLHTSHYLGLADGGAGFKVMEVYVKEEDVAQLKKK